MMHYLIRDSEITIRDAVIQCKEAQCPQSSMIIISFKTTPVNVRWKFATYR